MERSNGFNRGNGCNDNIRTQPLLSADGPQPDRQEDEWLVSPIAEKRDDVGR